MVTEEITISELELADEVLADMVLPIDTATDTKAVTLKQLKAWLGSSLPTGFIIPAVGKINDARFTLLDGKTLSRIGTYEAFCNKVVEQVQAGNWFSCSEEEYNADVSAFGQCGKFVVTNDYVRIPKITRFIGATITLSEIGKSYAESLPNIKGTFVADPQGGAVSGAFSNDDTRKDGRSGSDDYARTVGFDASRSSSTYQNGAKVQPDHTKFPYYMVVSTEGQTAEVEIDINKIYEDLELKVNKNLSNLTTEGKIIASGLGMPSAKYVNLTLGASGSVYTAPANGYFFISKELGKANGFVQLTNTTTHWLTSISFGNIASDWAMTWVPVRKGDVIAVSYDATGTTNSFEFIYAEGEN